MRPGPKGKIGNKYDRTAISPRHRIRPRNLKWMVADEVAKEDKDEEGMLRSVSELCAAYSENRLRNIIPLLLSDGHSSKAMAKSWAKLDPKERRHGFLSVVGYLLRESCLRFCARLIECCCIHDIHTPGPEDVALAMEFVVRLEFKLSQKQHRKRATPSKERTEKKASRYISLLLKMLRIDYGGPLRVRQATIYRLLHGASLEGVEQLYDGLKEARVILSTDTILHFIHRLSGPLKWAKAYSILEGLTQDRTRNLRVPQVWKGFQTMFYKATFIGEDESSKVIQMMLNCGIGPGLTSYNILMTKALRDGDEKSLTQIFRQMFDAGLKPSMVTYGILHNFYKRQGKELERINVIRDAMKLDKNLNGIIATDIVHAKIKTSEHYFPVLKEYLNYFNPIPLISLGIAPTELYSSRGTLSDKLDPGHIVVSAMVHAFVMHERDPMTVWVAYQRYRKLIESKESEYRKFLCKAGCYIPNAYMFALGQHEDTLRHTTMIMEDMLKLDSPVHPNVYSWSILLYAMSRNGKAKQAEQVLGAMRRKGINPNVVSWTSLLTGYVKFGNLRRAGDVLRRMGEERVAPNSKTLNLLVDIMDSEELAKGMMSGEREEQEYGSTEMTGEDIDKILMRNRNGASRYSELSQRVEL